MRIIKVKNYEEMSKKAAEIVAAQVILKPECVLGLATGSTPIGMYDRLVERYEQEGLDFSEVRTVNLDEYVGLSGENDQSYRFFMNQHLFHRVNIAMDHTMVPDGLAADAEKACTEYEEKMDALGGVDLQVLGLGPNGHIGFNEPGDHFEKSTHRVDLTDSTIQANKRFFASEDDVPKQAYTMGIGSIMKARKIIVLVSGAGKADALAKMLHGKITPKVPATILQLHSDVTVIADEDAFSAV